MHDQCHSWRLRTGLCGARLLVQNAKNPRGAVYPYFICARRHRLHTCNFHAVLIDEVERRVTDLYQHIQLTPEDRQSVERYLLRELDHIEANSQHDIRSLTTRRTNLEDERRSLLHAHYTGAVPLDLLKEEQARIATELASVQRQLDSYRADAATVRARYQEVCLSYRH